MPTLSERIWALAAPPKSGRPAGSDAELLANLRGGGADALGQLVTRHGPAVWRVCRARLGNGADVDDAFQATFLALAQSPGSVRNPDCLAAWLNGVAARVCLKLERHRRRHPASSLEFDPVGRLTDPATEAERRELSAAVLDEVARLPDKLRTVILLCSLGGQTSAETAGQLGVPVGTVESRLSTARARLKLRLERRGIAAAGLAIVFADATTTTAECARLLQLLAGPLGARPASQLVISLASGVTTTMSTLKLMTMTLLVGGALGGVGYGLAGGTDEGPPAKGAEGLAPAPPTEKQVAEAPMPPPVVKPADAPTYPPQPAEVQLSPYEMRQQLMKSEANTRAMLQKPAAKLIANPDGLSYGALFENLASRGVFYIRFDYPRMKRFHQLYSGMNAPDAMPVGPDEKLEEKKVRRGPQGSMTMGEYLDDLVSSISPLLTYRIRGDQVLITPAYLPHSHPGATNPKEERREAGDFAYLAELASGPPVSIAFQKTTLADAVVTLRQATGENIIVQAQNLAPAEAQPRLFEATLDDVRLITALEVIGMNYDLEPVYFRNVFYLTTPQRAKYLREKHSSESYFRPVLTLGASMQ